MTEPTAPAPRRARWTAALVLALVALAGLIGGVALDRAVLLPRAVAARVERARPSHRMEFPRARREFRHRLARELDLTPEQRAHIDSLLEVQAESLRVIRSTTHPRIESVIAGTRREMEAVLTPEQRARLAELGGRRRR